MERRLAFDEGWRASEQLFALRGLATPSCSRADLRCVSVSGVSVSTRGRGAPVSARTSWGSTRAGRSSTQSSSTAATFERPVADTDELRPLDAHDEVQGEQRDDGQRPKAVRDVDASQGPESR